MDKVSLFILILNPDSQTQSKSIADHRQNKKFSTKHHFLASHAWHGQIYESY